MLERAHGAQSVTATFIAVDFLSAPADFEFLG